MARRALGERAMQNRYRSLCGGRDLSPEREAVLRMVARLVIHAENLSGRLAVDGEVTHAGEVKAGLGKLIELHREIVNGLALVFPQDDQRYDLATLMSRKDSNGE